MHLALWRRCVEATFGRESDCLEHHFLASSQFRHDCRYVCGLYLIRHNADSFYNPFFGRANQSCSYPSGKIIRSAPGISQCADMLRSECIFRVFNHSSHYGILNHTTFVSVALGYQIAVKSLCKRISLGKGAISTTIMTTWDHESSNKWSMEYVLSSCLKLVVEYIVYV